ncbi:hypothetical protein D9M68_991380 [compost metagenome]
MKMSRCSRVIPPLIAGSKEVPGRSAGRSISRSSQIVGSTSMWLTGCSQMPMPTIPAGSLKMRGVLTDSSYMHIFCQSRCEPSISP